MNSYIAKLHELEYKLKQEMKESAGSEVLEDLEKNIEVLKDEILNIFKFSFLEEEARLNIALKYNAFKTNWIILNNQIQAINLKYGYVPDLMVYSAFILSKFCIFLEDIMDPHQVNAINLLLANYQEILNDKKKLLVVDENDVLLDGSSIRIYYPKKIIIRKKPKENG